MPTVTIVAAIARLKCPLIAARPSFEQIASAVNVGNGR